jgi:hypothetical protein
LQQIRSTITYLQNATFQAVTGVISQDANQDDDGNGSGSTESTIDEKQVADLIALCEDVGANQAKLKKYLKVERFDEILAKNYTTVVAQVEAKRRAK